MRDISHKSPTLRSAVARAVLRVSPASIVAIREGRVPKGDPLCVAKIAAFQAAKQTPLLIPFCHPVPVEHVAVDFEMTDDTITATATVTSVYKSGGAGGARPAAPAAVLNIYDLLKMIDDDMEITGVRLLEKRGGKSDWHRTAPGTLRAAVLVSSDSVAAGRKRDISGLVIRERLEREGLVIADYRILPDDEPLLEEALNGYADRDRLNLVVTTGGTGFGPRDRMPEVMRRVIDREAPGIAEAMRAYGQQRTPYAMLSRALAGIRGDTLIVNLPGSRGGVADSLDALLPHLLHAFKMLRGEGHPEGDRASRSPSRPAV